MAFFGLLIFAAIIGLIPAYIASKKGHDFFIFWIFGALLFIVALPVALLIGEDKEGKHRILPKVECGYVQYVTKKLMFALKYALIADRFRFLPPPNVV